MNLSSDFLSYRKQRVVLYGQHLPWDYVSAGVPQCSVLGPLSLLSYVNDLTNNLSSNCKVFSNDTSLLSVVNNIYTSAATLASQDLNGTTDWAFQWKMILNPDLGKQAQGVILSRKIKKLLHPTFLFNNIPLSNSLLQKHHGLKLDIKSNFSEHIKSITKKIIKLRVFYVHFNKFCQSYLFSLYIKLL